MRWLPLPLLAILLLPSTADAQRRRVVHDRDATRGTDIQALGDGISLDAVGLRFWLGPQTALTTRVTFGYADLDVEAASGGADRTAEALEVGVALGFERHRMTSGRVSPFTSFAASIGIRDGESAVSPDDGLSGGDDLNLNASDVRTTRFGAEAGIGAEFRIAQGLALSGAYLLRADYETGEIEDSFGDESDVDAFSVRLGGLPRLALSFRF